MAAISRDSWVSQKTSLPSGIDGIVRKWSQHPENGSLARLRQVAQSLTNAGCYTGPCYLDLRGTSKTPPGLSEIAKRVNKLILRMTPRHAQRNKKELDQLALDPKIKCVTVVTPEEPIASLSPVPTRRGHSDLFPKRAVFTSPSPKHRSNLFQTHDSSRNPVTGRPHPVPVLDLSTLKNTRFNIITNGIVPLISRVSRPNPEEAHSVKDNFQPGSPQEQSPPIRRRSYQPPPSTVSECLGLHRR